jgi:hypothetical protein
MNFASKWSPEQRSSSDCDASTGDRPPRRTNRRQFPGRRGS